jgi:hypothetical protein
VENDDQCGGGRRYSGFFTCCGLKSAITFAITLLPREMADSDVSFSGALKISNKVKKISATMRIHSMWNLDL